MLNYFDKMHPVVSVMKSSPSLICRHTHTQGRSFISGVSSMKDGCGWSAVSQLFVLGRVQLFVSATFKANVHEHEHEASWVTGPLKGSTMVIAIILTAQCSCGIGYMPLCIWCFCACVRLRLTDLHVWGCKGKGLMCAHVPFFILHACVCLLPSKKCLSHFWKVSG